MGAEVFRGSIFVEASPEEVFEYFTEAEALASWMGDRAVVEPEVGGRGLRRRVDAGQAEGHGLPSPA